MILIQTILIKMEDQQDSSILKLLKKQNPTKEYPIALGNKWTNDEESQLFDELHKEYTYEQIAKLHNRTIGSISSKIKALTYKLFENNYTIEYISEKTKLPTNIIECNIQFYKKKKENRKSKSTASSVSAASADFNKQLLEKDTEIELLKNELESMKLKYNNYKETSALKNRIVGIEVAT